MAKATEQQLKAIYDFAWATSSIKNNDFKPRDIVRLLYIGINSYFDWKWKNFSFTNHYISMGYDKAQEISENF